MLVAVGGISAIASNDHLFARSKPVVARVNESSSSVAYKFTVSANANRKIVLNQIKFDVLGLT